MNQKTVKQTFRLYPSEVEKLYRAEKAINPKYPNKTAVIRRLIATLPDPPRRKKANLS